jgi:hypothetical protein
MPYLKEAQGAAPPIPWIESYGNELDIVARLGVLAPRPDSWSIHIDGPRYLHRRARGHRLNAHYLAPIEHAQKKDRKPGSRRNDASPFVSLNAGEYPGAAVPRLYSYINGGSVA